MRRVEPGIQRPESGSRRGRPVVFETRQSLRHFHRWQIVLNGKRHLRSQPQRFQTGNQRADTLRDRLIFSQSPHQNIEAGLVGNPTIFCSTSLCRIIPAIFTTRATAPNSYPQTPSSRPPTPSQPFGPCFLHHEVLLYTLGMKCWRFIVRLSCSIDVNDFQWRKAIKMCSIIAIRFSFFD